MSNYTNFLGIDIGKKSFFASALTEKSTKEYLNNPEGFVQFFEEYNDKANKESFSIDPIILT